MDELLKKTEIHPEKLNGRISDDDLREIALFKTLTNWRTVATYLGLDKNDLDAIKQEEDDEQMRKLNALKKWKGKFGSKATYRKLVDVLLKLEKTDAAEDVCHLLKGILVYILVYGIRADHKISVHSVRRVGSLCPAYTLSCSQPIFSTQGGTDSFVNGLL